MDNIMLNLDEKSLSELYKIFKEISESFKLSEITLTNLSEKIKQLNSVIDVIGKKTIEGNEISNGYYRIYRKQLADLTSRYIIMEEKARLEQELKELNEKLRDGFNYFSSNIDLNDISLRELHGKLEVLEALITDVEKKIKEGVSLSKKDYEYLSECKKNLVSYKNIHQSKYNASVRAVNEEASQLGSSESLTESNTKINRYNTKKQYSEMNYDELEKLQNKFSHKSQIEAELSYIETELDSLEENLQSTRIENEEKISIVNELSNLYALLGALDVKVSNDQNMSLDEINLLMNRIHELNNRIMKLDEIVNQKMIVSDDKVNGEYVELYSMLSNLEGYVSGYVSGVLLSKKEEEDISDCQLVSINGKLDEIEKKIEEAFKNKKIDNNQYANLRYKLNSIMKMVPGNKLLIEESLEGKNKDELEEVQNNAEKQVQMLGKKHGEEKTKLKDKIKDVKNKIKDFMNSRPMAIKSVKDGRETYTKTEKVIIVVGGLAMMALMFNTVGRILIPAIMVGNLIMSPEHPVLKEIDNILGRMIGAKKKEDGTWVLANGLELNSTSATVSLLKSLAVSKKTSIVGNMIRKIKEVTSKISVKDKLSKAKEGLGKVRENFDDKNIDEKIAKLYRKFKGNLDVTNIEEFCKIENLTEEEKTKFVAYVDYKNIPVERSRRNGR